MHTTDWSSHDEPLRLPNRPTTGGGLIIEAALAAAVTMSTAQIVQEASEVPASVQDFKACVVERESHGNPKAKSRISSSAGKYQFLDNSWRRGLSYMIADRLRAFGMPKADATRIRVQLVSKPINHWPEGLQDVGFAAVIEQPNGWRHWSLPGSRCQRLALS